MKKKERLSPPPVGGSSLLVIFAVLCLTVFALLSLSTVQAEQRLSDAAAQGVTAYYQADLEAEKIFARLRAGETVPGVREENGRVLYTCPISENQMLQVELRKTKDSWQIIRWQAVAQPDRIEETLPVWDGT